MNFHRGLWAGVFLLLILSGCSKNKTLNVEGAYSPVISGISSDHEPAARGELNALTAVVTNVRGYPLKFHWSAGAGTLQDSTTQTAQWQPPDSIGIYPVTISVEAYDSANNVNFFATRTIQMYVENAYTRWTRSDRVQSDVVPPVQGKLYYSEIRNSATGESDVWAVASALGAPEQITSTFFTATSPTVQSDGSRLAFLGRRRSSDTGPSVWLVPPAGGDTTTAILAVQFNRNTNANLGSPRFAPTGSFLLYHTDSMSFGVPKPWIRDAANLAVAPFRLVPASASAEGSNTYWNGSWNGAGDSIVFESYQFFNNASFQQNRGLFKLRGLPLSNTVVPYSPWLLDNLATDPDWSPDGQYIVFTRKAQGSADRDIWIIKAGSSDKTTAVRVTRGPADDSHPRFSSDGNSIFFISNRADRYGLNGIYDIERRGTNAWSVSEFDRP